MKILSKLVKVLLGLFFSISIVGCAFDNGRRNYSTTCDKLNPNCYGRYDMPVAMVNSPLDFLNFTRFTAGYAARAVARVAAHRAGISIIRFQTQTATARYAADQAMMARISAAVAAAEERAAALSWNRLQTDIIEQTPGMLYETETIIADILSNGSRRLSSTPRYQIVEMRNEFAKMLAEFDAAIAYAETHSSWTVSTFVETLGNLRFKTRQAVTFLDLFLRHSAVQH